MSTISPSPDTPAGRRGGSGSRLRGGLRRALPGFEAGLRILAEGLPARDGQIDLLGADAEGRLVVVCVGRGESDGEAALAFSQALSTRQWIAGELPGWLQLVPDFEANPGMAIRTLLLLPSLPGAIRSAIEALPAGWIEPVVYRPFSHRGDDFILLEHAVAVAASPSSSAGVETRPPASEPPAPRQIATEPAAAEAARAQRETAATGDGTGIDATFEATGAEDPTAPPLPTLRSGITEADFERSGRSRRGATRQRARRPRFDTAES